MTNQGEITKLLQNSDKKSLEELLPFVYDELHSLAAALFNREFRAGHTLQPTALVHEAYLRLIGEKNEVSWQNRAHFFGIAARSMRQILVNHAVSHNREKRSGNYTVIALDEVINFLGTQNVEILELHEALEKFAKNNPRQAEIVELKFFGGLTIEEIAEVLNISPATVKRDWELSRGWLFRELKK